MIARLLGSVGLMLLTALSLQHEFMNLQLIEITDKKIDKFQFENSRAQELNQSF